MFAPRGYGPLARREMRLAYWLLVPTLLIVLSIVLVPLLVNFWISLKPIQLADLRPPTLLVNERLRGELGGADAVIEYRVRNSSQQLPLEQAWFSDTVPEGLILEVTDERCALTNRELRCELGRVEAKFNERIRLPVSADAAYAGGAEYRDSKPLIYADAQNVLTSFTFTLDNFRRVFSASEFWHVMRVTIYYTVFGTLGALVLGMFAALLLNASFPARGVLRGLFLFPYVAPVIAVAFTWVVLLDPFSGTLNSLLRQMQVIDTPISFFGKRYVTFDLLGISFDFPLALSTVIIFEAWRYFPLSFLFILARLQSISSEIYEAAEMDGATPLQQFWSISMPQLAGILAVLFLLRFIWTFNKFDDIFLLTGGGAGTRTLTVDVYEQAFAISNLGAGAAVAVVVFVVLLCFALVFFRYAPKDEG